MSEGYDLAARNTISYTVIQCVNCKKFWKKDEIIECCCIEETPLGVVIGRVTE